MLFLLALTLPLSFSLWKPTLKWITAFTLGHSISLAISALGWVTLPAAWVELAIAVTIALTVLVHLFTGFKVHVARNVDSGIIWFNTWFWISVPIIHSLHKASPFGGLGFLLMQALRQGK